MDIEDLMRKLIQAAAGRQAAIDKLGTDLSSQNLQAQVQQASGTLAKVQEQLDALQEQAQQQRDAARRALDARPEPPDRVAPSDRGGPAPVEPQAAEEPFPPGALGNVDRRFPLAKEVCARYEPSTSAHALLHDQPPRQFFDALVAQRLSEDASKFLAYGLSIRPALLWTALCLREEMPVRGLPGTQWTVLREAMAWVKDKKPEQLARAGEAFQKIGAATPAGCLALAVFASGPSLAPPPLPAVPPPPTLSAQSVFNAQRLLLAQAAAERTNAMPRRFLRLGVEIAMLPNPLPAAKVRLPEKHCKVFLSLQQQVIQLLTDLDLYSAEAPPSVDLDQEIWEGWEGWED